MTTTHSQPTPQHDSLSSGRWPVLARIPDLSTAARSAPKRTARPLTPPRVADRRIDAPQPRQSGGPAPASADQSLAETDTLAHPPHDSLPPAHHLNQRTVRIRPAHDWPPAKSPALPAWDPFASPGRRLHESFAPTLSFLVMVILFTAAGTSVLMLRSAGRQAAPDRTGTAAPLEKAAAVSTTPTAGGPLGISATRLEPAPASEASAVAISNPSSPQLAPAVGNDASAPDTTVRDVPATGITGIESSPAAAVPANDSNYPSTDFVEPEIPEANGIQLPQEQIRDTPLPIARFSGQILEAPMRQAKNDDESSIH